MMRKTITLVGLMLLTPWAQAAERVVCVSANNSGVPKGAIVVPSLQKGIETAGKYKQKGDHVTLLIAGGDYTLSKTLEMTARQLGTGDGKLIVRPLGLAEVTLRGGVNIPLEYLEKAPESESRIRPEVRDQIYCVDLRKAGVGTLTAVQNPGLARPALPVWTEVFVNDRSQKLSRWPNDTMALMGPVLEPGSIPREGDMSGRPGSFSYYDDRPSQWKSGDPKYIAGFLNWGYAEEMLRLGSIDTQNKTIHLAEPAMYGLISGEDYNRWYVINLLEEVDLPGEYYIDYEHQKLWIYPSEEIRTLSLSLLGEPLMAVEGVKNVEIEQLRFVCTRGIGLYMERTHNVVVRGCEFRNIGATAIVMGKGVDPNWAYNQEGTPKAVSRVIGTLASYVYNNTMFDREAGTNNGIVDCIIDDIGAGGISMGGGDRVQLTPGGNYVQNCRISRYNRVERPGRPGIYMIGVGNRISNCEIFDSPYAAIIFGGNDQLIEYNDIHDVCKEIDDLGAIYNGRDQTDQGNRLMYNYVHHLSAKRRVTAFYHDDGACAVTAIGNIFYQAGLQSVLLGGGSDHLYQNNMFIDIPYGLYVDNRLQNWAWFPEMEELYQKRFDAVNATQSPFKDKYPLAARYYEDGVTIPKRNRASHNLFYNISKLLVCPGERPFERSYMELVGNWWTWSGMGFEDPGFVDAQAENWNLKPDAAIFRYIPGFEAIPFDKIGCTLPASPR